MSANVFNPQIWASLVKRRILVVQPIHAQSKELLASRPEFPMEVVAGVSVENLPSYLGSAEATAAHDATAGKIVSFGEYRLRRGAEQVSVPVDYSSKR